MVAPVKSCVALHIERRFPMTGEKDKKDHPDTINHAPEDNLNAKIGVLTRREVEARILTPVLNALGEAALFLSTTEEAGLKEFHDAGFQYTLPGCFRNLLLIDDPI